MATPYISEIKLVSFNFPPKGWAFCNGQTLPINQNQALFSLLGTMYGGNGQTTFALPNLQGRVPLHVGQGFVQGQVAGEQAHTLTTNEMATHNHLVNANSTPAPIDTGADPAPTSRLAASVGSNLYGAPADPVALSAASGKEAITASGGGQPHDNMAPTLVLNFVIALVGLFPSRP